jgi:methionyl-tRNA formyltransferase
MKLAIFTTQTLHHTFFVREVASRVAVSRVYCETSVRHAPFETGHPFEKAREEYEKHVWFGGADRKISDFAATETVSSVNDANFVKSLENLSPDAAVVFGTGRISPAVLEVCPRLTLNLHGGDPEQYRGLDSHLWAIYHRDYAGLVTTLHRITRELDDGDIVGQADIPLFRGMEIHEIRRFNTEACVQLTAAALSTIAAAGDVTGRRQRWPGRYYSHMPAPLKELCRQRFAKYTAQLSAKKSSRG